MGKMLTFVSILIFIDLLFLTTAQFGLESPGSVILNAINDLSTLKTANIWIVLIDGLSGLVIATAVIAGLVTRSSDIAIFFAMAGTLALLIGDFLAIYIYLASISFIFATIVMAPIGIIFTFVVIDWAKGKD